MAGLAMTQYALRHHTFISFLRYCINWITLYSLPTQLLSDGLPPLNNVCTKTVQAPMRFHAFAEHPLRGCGPIRNDCFHLAVWEELRRDPLGGEEGASCVLLTTARDSLALPEAP
jgi:hypothetical protein